MRLDATNTGCTDARRYTPTHTTTSLSRPTLSLSQPYPPPSLPSFLQVYGAMGRSTEAPAKSARTSSPLHFAGPAEELAAHEGGPRRSARARATDEPFTQFQAVHPHYPPPYPPPPSQRPTHGCVDAPTWATSPTKEPSPLEPTPPMPSYMGGGLRREVVHLLHGGVATPGHWDYCCGMSPSLPKRQADPGPTAWIPLTSCGSSTDSATVPKGVTPRLACVLHGFEPSTAC